MGLEAPGGGSKGWGPRREAEFQIDEASEAALTAARFVSGFISVRLRHDELTIYYVED